MIQFQCLQVLTSQTQALLNYKQLMFALPSTSALLQEWSTSKETTAVQDTTAQRVVRQRLRRLVLPAPTPMLPIFTTQGTALSVLKVTNVTQLRPLPTAK